MFSNIKNLSVVLVTFSLFFLSSCHQATLPNEYLDPDSAVTVKRVSEPMEFYRNRVAAGAHAKDLIRFAPVEVNRQGDRTLYLWLGFWSTLEAKTYREFAAKMDAIHLLLDETPMELRLLSRDHQTIGLSSRVYELPVPSAKEGYYEVTSAQLRRITESKSLSLVLGTEQQYRYRLWGSASDFAKDFAGLAK